MIWVAAAVLAFLAVASLAEIEAAQRGRRLPYVVVLVVSIAGLVVLAVGR